MDRSRDRQVMDDRCSYWLLRVPVMTHIDDSGITNPSDNLWLSDIIASRRRFLAGGLTAAVAVVAAPKMASATAAFGSEGEKDRKRPRLGFTPLAAGLRADTVTVPKGYSWQVLAPWGDPIVPSGPAFANGKGTAADQNLQMGMHHDGMHYFPIRKRGRRQRGLMVINHEYIDQTFLFGYPGKAPFPDLTTEQLDLALAAHGVSIIDIVRDDGKWLLQESKFARRVTTNTPVEFSGPVAEDHPMLVTGAEPRGTVNNCSMGHTPWNTYLACEENFNGYFGSTSPDFKPDPLQARYGLTATGFDYGWHTAPDSRFDLAKNPNEPHRFGWVVEIDPFDPDHTPVKRTALGRFKHEGAFVQVSKKDRVVVYMGDDQDGDYLYKYVSADSYQEMLEHGVSPLDEGTLYVAKFADDGSGIWLAVVHGEGPLTEANGWKDQADVLIRTRLAADALGASKLDRCEWTSVDPVTGTCYVSMTNGSGGRGKVSGDRAPKVGNPFGQIVRWEEADGDHAAMTFTWEVFLFAGDPTKTTVPNTNVSDENRFGSPDGLWIDQSRRVWIETDVSNSKLHKGDYDRMGNNQMLCADPDTKEVRRFLSGPEGCEITGVIGTPDQKTLFINIQHPGETQPSTFPFGTTPPRSCTIVITKDDGGQIGS
jgi:uncharacterized protein